MRLRRRPARLSGEASPDPDLAAGRLYFITPDVDRKHLAALVGAAIRGGADIIQLRQKKLARGELLEAAHELRAITAEASKLFVVNDHVDIALLAGADAVHLGPDDVTVEAARAVAGEELLIGASASSPEAARVAVAAGADYLGVGPAFETPIKTEKEVIGPEGVARVARAVHVPVFAIGGIDLTNLELLTALGVQRVCVIRAIGDASDPEAAARRLRAMLDS
ncbi:MAG TPA: thiamine phosphate synthase [Candidatus Dormibacteraeota bacterium]|nr:thiamine phosphate synthase [Candidatus Dormibacteraeota bacterium]